MKTPREILLAQHRAAEPKLDDIRRAAVAELSRQDTKEPGWLAGLASWCLAGSKIFWSELIWPCRRIWTGLVAVWILIFAVNLSQRDKSEVMAEKSPPPAPEMILAFRQQEKLLAELIGSNEPRDAEPQKLFLPRPSSELPFEIMMT